MYVCGFKSEKIKDYASFPWAKIENFLSLYSCAHDGLCKKCAIAEYEASGGFQLNWTGARWISAVVWSVSLQDGFVNMLFDPNFVATFGKYDSRTGCDNGTRIGRQHCYDDKQVVHPY